jgi:hypothetical protein
VIWVAILAVFVGLGVTSCLATNSANHDQSNKRQETASPFCGRHLGVKKYDKYILTCGDGKHFWWDAEGRTTGWRRF